MKLGYVCTSFKNIGYTEKAIRSLHAQSGEHEYHVVVVDNGSLDRDVAHLRAIACEFPHVEVMAGHGNIGYFPGLNLGIEHLRALPEPPELIVAGNDDLEFPAGFTDSLVRHRDLFERWAVVAPDLVTPAGVHQNPLVRVPITRAREMAWALYFSSFALATVMAWAARATHRWTARPERVHGAENAREAGPVIQGYGACYILGPVFFQHFVRLYGPTFLMQEEYFLSEQLATVGQQVYYEPRFVLRHRDHATFDRLPGRQVWEVTRDSHQSMRRFMAMSREQQVEAVALAAGRPLAAQAARRAP
jgi:GT2 family glycosyltransferase